MSTTPPSSWTGDGGNVNTIAAITDFGASAVDSATGAFAPNLGSPVIWGPTPLVFATPGLSNPLWTTVLGFQFTVDADPLSISRIDRPFPLPDTLGLAGLGILTAPGFDPTPGGWTWTGTMNGTATFTFASTALPIDQPPPPGVPDGGATLALFGVALSGLGLLRRVLA